MTKYNELVAELNKLSKDYTVTYADDPESPCVVDDWIPTGCLALDKIMGKGLPVGRIVEIYGDSSSGKSLVAEQIAAIAQDLDYIVLYIDTERAVSLDMLDSLGVDTTSLIYAEPVTIQDTFQVMETFLAKKPKSQKGVIIWDSIAATTEESEKENAYDSHQVGAHARAISKGLRKFNRLISASDSCAIFINQTRQKIGVMFGDDTATFGGKAVEFYSSVRIELKKGKMMKNKAGKIIGVLNRAHNKKNKVATPFLKATLPIYFGFGIDDAASALEYIKENKEEYADRFKSGSWSEYITADGEIIKFQASSWEEKVFDPYYDDVADMILGG